MRPAFAALLALLATPAAAQGVPPLGTEPLDLKGATRYYEAVCLDSGPGFTAAPATLQANGFAPNPETGTFYHPRFNLSFHVDDACSMVFASPEAPGVLGLSFAATTLAAGGSGDISTDPATGWSEVDGPNGTHMTFGPLEGPSGASYFRALLEPLR